MIAETNKMMYNDNERPIQNKSKGGNEFVFTMIPVGIAAMRRMFWLPLASDGNLML